MADDPKTRPTDVAVEDFLSTLDDPTTRDDCRALVTLLEHVSGEPAVMWGPNIIGFGSYHYRYASGREGDAAVIGFSPRVGKLSLYLNDGTDQHTEALAHLGRHSASKACLHVKRLADVDTEVLTQILRTSYENTRDAHA